MPPGLVIFDCDGTLVDSELLGNTVLVEVVAEYGLELTVADALTAFRGGKMAETVAELERRLGRGLPDDFVAQVRRRTAEAFERSLQPVAGALELVASLSGAKCVASSGPRAKIELSLSLTGLLPHFHQRIFSSYEVGVWKPDPGLFLHAARTLGYAPGECAVVEDSMPGIRAGLAAGMKVFAYQPQPPDEPVPPDVVVVKHLADLRPHLARRE
jgi:HAD superfamily hydrolase (TIGR01509 family)